MRYISSMGQPPGRAPHSVREPDQLSSHLGPDPVLPVGHPNTYAIYELLDCAREQMLKNQIWNHIMDTRDKNLKYGCDGQSLSNGPEFMVFQRP